MGEATYVAEQYNSGVRYWFLSEDIRTVLGNNLYSVGHMTTVSQHVTEISLSFVTRDHLTRDHTAKVLYILLPCSVRIRCVIQLHRNCWR